MPLPTANLCRLNLRQASCLVDRTRSAEATTPGTDPLTSISTAANPPTDGIRSVDGPGGRSSCIANPRVQHRVHDVGHEVEQDHEEDRDHQPGENLGIVPVPHGGDEEITHPLVLEDRLRDDQAA